MKINDLTLFELNGHIEYLIAQFFGVPAITPSRPTLLTKSYQVELHEIKKHIPLNYQKHFNDTDIINKASGRFTIQSDDSRYNDYEYTAILLSNLDYSTALFLFVEERNIKTGDNIMVMVKNFMRNKK